MAYKYNGIRNLRTTQERRRNSDPEERPYFRGKRSWKRLPDSWDDYCKWVHRSWKCFRHTQYKPSGS